MNKAIFDYALRASALLDFRLLCSRWSTTAAQAVPLSKLHRDAQAQVVGISPHSGMKRANREQVKAGRNPLEPPGAYAGSARGRSSAGSNGRAIADGTGGPPISETP